MKRLMIAAVALLAAACQPMPATDGAASAAPQQSQASAAGSTDAALCASQGGKMLPQGRMQSVRCVIAYADAGKRCTTGSDCQGDCRIEETAGTPDAGAAVIGRCQVDSTRFGCFTTVENGKAEATLCID
jgi:putative hemolysin